MSHKWQPTARVALLLIAAFALTLCLRMAWVISKQQAQALHQIEQGNMELALKHYERAIHAYLPLWPPHWHVIEEMRSHILALESKGEKTLALEGWRRMRGAILSTRNTFGQPDGDFLAEANQQISRLAAETDAQGRMSIDDIQNEAAQLLAKHPKDVNFFWGWMQFLLLLLWAGATCRLIWCWDSIQWQERGWWATGAATSWAGWLAALYLAA